jgi:hypothetical protein
MERAGLHVMFYYYSECLHLGKTKENFSIVRVIHWVLLIQGISRVIVPDGIKNVRHNSFSNFRKKLATEIKISSFIQKWLNTNKRFI